MELSRSDFIQLREIIGGSCGIQLQDGKEYLVDSRLLPLMLEFNLVEYRYLVARLKGGDQRLLTRVIDAITTNETLWFRDSSFYGALRQQVIPQLLNKARSAKVRLWSAACSSGQEPYSVALAWLEECRIAKVGAAQAKNLQIVATDISEAILNQAASGSYNMFAISRGMPKELLERYFTPNGTCYNLNSEPRELVKFSKLNLLEPFPQQAPFDLILCRNVLIYFSEEIKSSILGRFHRALGPDGMLVLGGAETITGTSAYSRAVINGYPFFRPGVSKAVAAPVVTAKGGGEVAHERRRHTRLPLAIKGELHLDGLAAVAGITRDISFGGALFAGIRLMTATSGAEGSFSLLLKEDPLPVTARFRCRVVRTSSMGVAIRFTSTDQSGYNHLRNLFIYNSSAPDALLKELAHDPGVLISGVVAR